MIKHNRQRNIGILFEVITHSILDCVSKNDLKTAGRLFYLVNKHYMNENSEITKAFKLYSQLLYNESRNYFYAQKMMKYLTEEARSLDGKQIKKETDSLIEGLDKISNRKDLMKRKIPNYKLFASFKVVSDNHSFKMLSPTEKIKCEQAILEHFMNNEENKRVNAYNLNESAHDIDVNKIAELLAVKNFQQRYGHSLNEEQRDCLIKYFTTDNDKTFARWAEKRFNTVSETISNKIDLIDDENVKHKLSMVVERFSGYKNKNSLSSEGMTDLLLSYELDSNLKLY